MTNKTYDTLKYIVQIVFPAIGALYFALGNIWGLPAVEEVLGSISAVAIFLGTTLRISTKAYENSEKPYDGEIIGKNGEDITTWTLSVNDLDQMFEKDKIVLKVQSPSS